MPEWLNQAQKDVSQPPLPIEEHSGASQADNEVVRLGELPQKVEELERRANMAHVRAATAEANEIWARMERDQLKAAGGGGEGNRSKTSPTPDDDDTPRLSRWHQPGSLVAVIIAIVAILWALRVAPFLTLSNY